VNLFPKFKGGTYSSNPDGTVLLDFGAGVFLPSSGLGYFSQNKYSSVCTFNFQYQII
jgi:hypothetical protein